MLSNKEIDVYCTNYLTVRKEGRVKNISYSESKRIWQILYDCFVVGSTLSETALSHVKSSPGQRWVMLRADSAESF